MCFPELGSESRVQSVEYRDPWESLCPDTEGCSSSLARGLYREGSGRDPAPLLLFLFKMAAGGTQMQLGRGGGWPRSYLGGQWPPPVLKTKSHMAPGLLRQVSLQSWMAWNAVCRPGLKLTPDPSQPPVLELQVRTTQLSPPPPSPPLLSCLFFSLSQPE